MKNSKHGGNMRTFPSHTRAPALSRRGMRAHKVGTDRVLASDTPAPVRLRVRATCDRQCRDESPSRERRASELGVVARWVYDVGMDRRRVSATASGRFTSKCLTSQQSRTMVQSRGGATCAFTL